MAKITNLSAHDVATIKARIQQGDLLHDIAADYGLNQGRVSEINTGKRWPHIKPLAGESL